MKAATWALDHGVSIVVCNGKLDNAILNVVRGKNIGTFFTHARISDTPVEVEAAQGKLEQHMTKSISRLVQPEKNQISMSIVAVI